MLSGLIAAFSFLTTLPMGWLARSESVQNAQPGRMFAYFPLVGLVIGAIVAAVASIGFLPKLLVAFLVVMAWVALTGGLHLDGVADSCDGLFATTTPERRLEIMKDPRAGSWAVIGIVLVLLGKWTAVQSIPAVVLILPPIAGRWAMVLAVAGFSNARSTGSAAHFRVGFGRAGLIVATVSTVVLIVIFSLLSNWRYSVVLAIPPVAVLVVGRWAAARLGGGLTGDVYGALCELVELLCLITLNIF